MCTAVYAAIFLATIVIVSRRFLVVIIGYRVGMGEGVMWVSSVMEKSV